MSISIKNISKLYGKQKALDDVSLEIKSGEIVGLLGPNGAGKSTLMKIISCYIPQTEGQVEVMGHNVIDDPIAVKRKIGYLPESNALYYEMYVKEYLNFVAGIFKIKNKKERIAEIIELTGLQKEQHKKIGALSKGYKQRVGIAQAFIHNPDVLILDEPISGLDPNQLIEIRNMIKKIGETKTVLFSSHIMQEVEAVCDRIIIIKDGKVIADSPKSEIQKLWKNKEIIFVEFKEEIDEKILSAIDGVENVSKSSNGKYRITVASKEDIRPSIYDCAKDNNLTLIGLQSEEISLEHIFQDLTK
ncbi:MAG: gliding motility-associated ABC transporter ATP-binding subunit GldA [Bacteroidales bacterium]|nr:gliding motility-associated ABC transporter ATP-binding subunit GldA [Bacteroidales bacterium]